MKVGIDKGEGEGYRHKTRWEDRDKKWDEKNRKIVTVQQACKSLHSRELHMEIRGNEAAVAFCILSDLIWSKGKVFVLQRLLYAQSK